MNFLAHGLLGGDHPDMITGSFLGDFFKGPVPTTLIPGLRMGVKLHRHIDAASNAHPGIRNSIYRYPPSQRRFAPVFLDVLGDHFLARHFSDYSENDLPHYTRSLYPMLEARREHLPKSAIAFVNHLVRTDLLHRYAMLEQLPAVFLSIEKRFRRPQKGLADSMIQSSIHNYTALESDFRGYFPELQDTAAKFCQHNSRELEPFRGFTPEE